MIMITLDHSYEEDYFVISHIEVNMADKDEEERITKRFERMQGQLVDIDNGLKGRIAKVLGVETNLIDLDTNEIDIM